ncbi:MAG: SRPBCC family protein [Actinomycetota bacterium]|nr:SRPBCC family protein [Actinomycetota bacterium]
MTLETVNPHRSAPAHPRSERPRIISARKEVRVPPESVYGFLATLDNHWLLTDRFVSIVRLHGPVQLRTGGEIIIRGPWGLHRHARTRLEVHEDASRLVGTAAVGRRTVARVTWALTPIPEGTDVTLTASVLAASPLDRVLLVVAAPWLRRRFLAAIVRLEQETARPAAPTTPAASAGAALRRR